MFYSSSSGIIHVPALIYLLSFPVHIATSTSHFVLAIMSGSATIVHLTQNSLSGRGLITILLVIGVIPGAQLGAYLSRKMNSKWIIRILADAMTLSAARILWQAL